MTSLSASAYTKLMLHACQYPAEPIWGLLLGSVVGEKRRVTDIAPLFHSDLVASTMEAALMVVQACCNSEAHQWQGLAIVGCYAANRLETSNSVNSVTARFGHAIRKGSGKDGSAAVGGGTILIVDNSTLDDANATALKAFTSSKDGSWNSCSSSALQVDEGANGQLTKCLSDGVVVTDFDDHLDDTSSSFVIEL
jgi:hypothetical protein